MIETKRLLLREFSLDDASGMLELNADPEVLKYTGDPPFIDLEEAESFIIDYDQYRKYGHGRWAVLLKEENNRFIGWCGLKYHADTDEVDLGFRLMSSFWNKGLATEAAVACLDYGFNVLGINEIMGRVMENNSASRKVLEKIGMLDPRPFVFDEHPGLKYTLNKKQYERRKLSENK